jgi:glycine cleavage system regulatory protein
MGLNESLEALRAEVEQQSGTVESVVTLIDGQHVEILELREQLEQAGATPEQLALIDGFASALAANRDRLAEAVASPGAET